MREFNEKFYGNQRDKSEMTPPLKLSAAQRRYQQLASKASKQNLSPSQQRLMDRLGAKIAKDPKTIYSIPTDPGEGLMKKLGDPNFRGDTSVPNVNTIGAPMPTKTNTPSDVIMAPPLPLPSIQGGPSDGPYMPRPTGPQPNSRNTGSTIQAPPQVSPQPTSGIPNIGAGTPANFYNTPTTPPPPGAVYKKGGAVKAKKMASGGMTSKASPARRGDGIAQRGKTKGRMV